MSHVDLQGCTKLDQNTSHTSEIQFIHGFLDSPIKTHGKKTSIATPMGCFYGESGVLFISCRAWESQVVHDWWPPKCRYASPVREKLVNDWRRVPEGWKILAILREIVTFVGDGEWKRDLFGKVGLSDQPNVWGSKGHKLNHLVNDVQWFLCLFILVRKSQLNTMRSLLANEILATSRFMRICKTKFRTDKLYIFCFFNSQIDLYERNLWTPIWSTSAELVLENCILQETITTKPLMMLRYETSHEKTQQTTNSIDVHPCTPKHKIRRAVILTVLRLQTTNTSDIRRRKWISHLPKPSLHGLCDHLATFSQTTDTHSHKWTKHPWDDLELPNCHHHWLGSPK